MGESRRLSTAQREIDPLQSKRDNPVKHAARATGKARQSKKSDDIAAAASKTGLASMYARSHGYPNLTKQLGKHKATLRKFALAVKTREVSQTKAAAGQRVRDLKAKLWRRKLQRRRAATKR